MDDMVAKIKQKMLDGLAKIEGTGWRLRIGRIFGILVKGDYSLTGRVYKLSRILGHGEVEVTER